MKLEIRYVMDDFTPIATHVALYNHYGMLAMSWSDPRKEEQHTETVRTCELDLEDDLAHLLWEKLSGLQLAYRDPETE